jgi:predicted nucleic acid-binding protein
VILVDSSVLIDYLEGRDNPSVARFMEVLDHEIPYGISPFTLLEVLQGAATAKDFGTLRDYLASQTLYDLTRGPDSYIAASKLYFDLRGKGLTVSSSVDCLIAQTAIEHNLHLLHNDADYDRIAKVSPLKIYR